VESLDRDRLVEKVLALATKRSRDARLATGALAAFRAALGTRDEAHRARAASREPATALLAAARITKRLAREPEDLVIVERLLRAAASVEFDEACTTTADTFADDATDGAANDDVSGSAASREAASRRAAQVELGVLLCQEGRDAEATELLTVMGFRYRLAREVLRYPETLSGVVPKGRTKDPRSRVRIRGCARLRGDEKKTPKRIPVCAFDDALPARMLGRLRDIFAERSPFWEEHGYYEEGCEFFSYAHDLRSRGEGVDAPKPKPRLPEARLSKKQSPDPTRDDETREENPKSKREVTSLMDAVIRRVQRVASVHVPEVLTATAAEWWAHSRPHSSGHQMHFDSDDEGSVDRDGKRKHPLCSAVAFVAGGVGGPTLVTDQRDDSKTLTRNGWLIAPVTGRIAVFDGECLHGVLPGRGVCGLVERRGGKHSRVVQNDEPRRITLMVAFWRDVEIRGTVNRAVSGRGERAIGSFPRGSARPFPDPETFANDPTFPKDGLTTWPRLFSVASEGGGGVSDAEDDGDDESWRRKECEAFPTEAVWEDVDEEKNANCFPSLAVTALHSLPRIDACFMF
jgi:hypothetical protein